VLRLRPVLSKRAGVALGLWGEAGIGKSFAIQQLLGQIQCQGFSLHSTASVTQWVTTLPASNRLEMWAETILNRLSKGEHLPPESAADALGALLGKLAPVVLHLEDLHEANPERQQLILHVRCPLPRTRHPQPRTLFFQRPHTLPVDIGHQYLEGQVLL
jgi:hypothetical protein